MSLKVLVVDDDPASLRLIRPLGAGLSHAVLTCENCQQAAQRVQTERIDLAFLGMDTTNLDAFAVVRSIRNSQINREAIVVMLSVTGEIKMLRSAFAEGADVVLTKPLQANRIRAVLAAMESSGWKGKRKVRMPLFADVKCRWNDLQVSARSLNISETGMLLQPAIQAEVGREIAIEFTIPDLAVSVKVPVRIVRKEEQRSFAVEFMKLAPEEQNAIRIYVMGRLKDLTPARDTSDLGIRRLQPLS